MLQTIIDFGTIELFGFSFTPRVYGYGLMLVLGFISGIWLAHWRAKRMGENHETVTVVGILSLVGGIVGARAASIIQNWEQFRMQGLGGVLDVTSGGLIYYGGLIGGALLVVLYLKSKRIAIRRYLDIVAVSLMVGLAFGRAGCFLNGCCYGGKCSEQWALATHFPMYSKPLLKFDGRDNPFSEGTQGVSPVYGHQLEQRAIALDKLGLEDSVELRETRKFEGLINPDPCLTDTSGIPREVYYEQDGHTHAAKMLAMLPPASFTDEQTKVALESHSLAIRPAQALGFFNALLLALLLCIFFRYRRREGQVFAVLVIIYPITRFLLENIRIDTAVHYGLTHNQYTSLATAVAGIIMLLVISKLPASAGPTWAQRLAVDAQQSAQASTPKRNKRKR